MVVPLLDDGQVILERIYRYPVQQTLLECPSGGLEGGGLEGESFEAAAHRELLEETGWEAERMSLLGTFLGSTGISDERFQLFLATGLRQVGEPMRESTEQMELEWLPLADAAELARSGRILDAPTALALMLAEHAVRAGVRGGGAAAPRAQSAGG